MGPAPRTFLQPVHPAVLEEANPGLPRGLGEAQRVVQRVELAAAGVQKTPDIAIAGDEAPGFGPAEQPPLVVAVGPLFLAQPPPIGDLPPCQGGQEIAPVESTFEAVPRETLARYQPGLLVQGPPDA